jgi:hypothetical protein
MDLWLGAGPLNDPQPFASAEARAAAWQRHREHLIRKLPSSPGKRPVAWWQYDSPVPYPGPDKERSALYLAGLLGAEEKVELEAEWREAFARAQRLGFMFCTGPGEVLHGEAARRALYRWSDIPAGLIRRWSTARRRNARIIRGPGESRE